MSANQGTPAVDELHAGFVEAFRANDPEVLSGFFTENSVLLPPARAILSGRNAIIGFWQSADRIQDLAFEATEVELLNESVLREAGNLQITMRGQGRETRSQVAKYIAVWLRGESGWKLDCLIWNGAGGAAGQQQGAGRTGAGRGGRGGGGGGQGGGGGRGGRGGGGGGYGQGGGGGRGGYGAGGGGRRRQGGGGFGPGGGGGYGGGGQGGGQGGGGRGGRGGGQGGGGQGGGGQGGGGQGGQGGYGGGGGGGGGGFGPRAQQQRINQEAPMVPRID